MIREAEIVLFREEYNVRLSNIKWSALKTHTSIIILTVNIYIYIYIYDHIYIYDYTCMHISIIKKDSKNFK